MARHRLHPEADPVDAAVSYAVGDRDVDVVGIALDRDLGAAVVGIDAMTAARPAAGTCVGVPPPTNTVVATGMPSSTARAMSTVSASR